METGQIKPVLRDLTKKNYKLNKVTICLRQRNKNVEYLNCKIVYYMLRKPVII